MKKNIRIKILFAALLFSPNLLAASDNSEWQTLDAAFGAQSLCDAYQNDEEHLYERTSCFMKCDTWTYRLKIKCEANKKSSPAQVAELTFIKTADGKAFSKGEITQDKWENNKKNPLRFKAANVESFGKIFILESVTAAGGQFQNDVIVARFKIYSRLTTGEHKVVGEGAWWIKTSAATISQKIIKKEYTTYALGKETSTDSLIMTIE